MVAFLWCTMLVPRLFKYLSHMFLASCYYRAWLSCSGRWWTCPRCSRCVQGRRSHGDTTSSSPGKLLLLAFLQSSLIMLWHVVAEWLRVPDSSRGSNVIELLKHKSWTTTKGIKPGLYFLQMRIWREFGLHNSCFAAQLNPCEVFVANMWRQHSYRIRIRRKYKPGVSCVKYFHM